ncbi:MAG: hypothetical protein PHY16_15180 [Methylobacter sp.]|nr:hypothetical protein [Methylobacter sp.]
MQTVFSHIIQKRFSQVNEDVATDALAFILHSNEYARNGMMKLLRGIVADIPDLHFRTQQTEGNIRPDMWGISEIEPRVFVENKFWAGLTENQPTFYLKQLAKYTQSTILLVIVPEAREQTMWREHIRRLEDAGISVMVRDTTAGVVHSFKTDIGPILALTSWTKLLSALELEIADDQSAKSDLLQLRALCKAADSEAFIPISSTELTDQRTPALILQMGSVVQASVGLAVTEGVLNIKRLMPQASWERIGQYARLSDEQGVGIWFGIHFGFWKKYGGTPFWLVFSSTQFGRAHEVRALVESWAAKQGLFTASQHNEFVVAIEVAFGEDKDQVVRNIVECLKRIADILSVLNRKSSGVGNA